MPSLSPVVIPTLLPQMNMTPDPNAVQGLFLPQPTVQPETSGGRGMGRSGMGMGMGMAQVTAIAPLDQTTNPGLVQPSGSMSGIGGQTGQTMPGGMGPRMRGGQVPGSIVNGNMWSMMGHRVIVADTSGKIVSDSSGQANGAVLSTDQLAGGEAIQVAGQKAGTVLVGAARPLPGTPADEFLRALNNSILVAVLAAGAAAMVLGSLLFFQITAPLRNLKAAAGAIAAGDLTQRVQVRTRDELGDLGLVFNNMAESLSRVEAQRRQMVADVAHELRTPLSVMQANLEAMQDGILPLDAGEIASLHEETVLLSRLVADLHLLSLAEAGQLKLERVKIEPGELVRKSTERLYQRAQERGVEINVKPSPPLPPVSADAGRINQGMVNLVSNALRYTDPGGKITVRVETPPEAAVRSVPEVLVSVTDTGCGIPESDLPHIFDRFYRADKSRTRASGGSGLGLAIVKYIVEAHGGRVWAESPARTAAQKQDRGTRISFTLPLS
jgi:two-component system OmpR family sensor kinase/two-component system sensor histidine kinase BaeS